MAQTFFIQNVSTLDHQNYNMIDSQFSVQSDQDGVLSPFSPASSMGGGVLAEEPIDIHGDPQLESFLSEHLTPAQKYVIKEKILYEDVPYNITSDELIKVLLANPKDKDNRTNVRFIRKVLPALRVLTFMRSLEFEGKRKIKGLWHDKPAGWPDHVPHKDPNNAERSKNGENVPKANGHELREMFKFLRSKFHALVQKWVNQLSTEELRQIEDEHNRMMQPPMQVSGELCGQIPTFVQQQLSESKMDVDMQTEGTAMAPSGSEKMYAYFLPGSEDSNSLVLNTLLSDPNSFKSLMSDPNSFTKLLQDSTLSTGSINLKNNSAGELVLEMEDEEYQFVAMAEDCSNEVTITEEQTGQVTTPEETGVIPEVATPLEPMPPPQMMFPELQRVAQNQPGQLPTRQQEMAFLHQAVPMKQEMAPPAHQPMVSMKQEPLPQISNVMEQKLLEQKQKIASIVSSCLGEDSSVVESFNEAYRVLKSLAYSGDIQAYIKASADFGQVLDSLAFGAIDVRTASVHLSRVLAGYRDVPAVPTTPLESPQPSQGSPAVTMAGPKVTFTPENPLILSIPSKAGPSTSLEDCTTPRDGKQTPQLQQQVFTVARVEEPEFNEGLYNLGIRLHGSQAPMCLDKLVDQRSEKEASEPEYWQKWDKQDFKEEDKLRDFTLNGVLDFEQERKEQYSETAYTARSPVVNDVHLQEAVRNGNRTVINRSDQPVAQQPQMMSQYPPTQQQPTSYPRHHGSPPHMMTFHAFDLGDDDDEEMMEFS